VKAAVISSFGSSDRIHIVDRPYPLLENDEVLIRNAYAGVNPVDWKICEGRLKSLIPHEFPAILGWECAGIVEKVGSVACSLAEGDKVYSYCRKPTVQWGTFAEYTCVHHTAVAKVPHGLTLKEAAVIPLAGLTAWQVLFEKQALKKGMHILIHAGAGGVGGYALQFARSAGAKIATTASARNHEYVRNMGADYAIDYTETDFVEAGRSFAPEGFDFIFDTVGGETLRKSYALLKPDGVLKSIVEEPNQELAPTPDTRMSFVFVRPNAVQLQEIGALVEDGVLKVPEIEEFPLEQAAQALQKSKAGHVRGKIVLKIP
jgi:NADPH2:quinone reductase